MGKKWKCMPIRVGLPFPILRTYILFPTISTKPKHFILHQTSEWVKLSKRFNLYKPLLIQQSYKKAKTDWDPNFGGKMSEFQISVNI